MIRDKGAGVCRRGQSSCSEGLGLLGSGMGHVGDGWGWRRVRGLVERRTIRRSVGLPPSLPLWTCGRQQKGGGGQGLGERGCAGEWRGSGAATAPTPVLSAHEVEQHAGTGHK